MDKRIVIGMALVVILCCGAWWFVSPANSPPATFQPARSPSQEIVQSPSTELTPAQLTSASSATESQRATLAEPTPIAATTSDETALVKVLVIDKSTRAKMPGVKVTSGDTRSRGRTWGEDRGLSRGKPWDTLRTNAEGRAEIETPAHAELIVSGSADRSDGGYVMMTAEPLEPGTTTEIVLEIPTGVDLPCWMRIVDEMTRAPVIGATVSANDTDDGERKYTCDTQGFVFVPDRSWAHTLLQVQAPEHAGRYLMAERGHARVEDALVIALPSSATLRVHVVDGAGASVVSARVVMTARGQTLSRNDDSSESFHHLSDPRWESQTDASGIATLTGLPPRVPMQARITSPRPWTSAQDLELEPAEIRDVEWKLTNGCLVRGMLLDQTDTPVVARRVSLRRADRKKAAYFRWSPIRR
jgi:hypothetical protein